MKLRVLVASLTDGTDERMVLQVYLDADKADEPAEEFFPRGHTIDLDKTLDGLGELDNFLDLPLPFNRELCPKT